MVESRSAGSTTSRTWWKESVVYQIYPRSFNDSNDDGIGDIPGIVEKVEYLDELGVDVVWLCPVYESPMADNGYDISDYRSIHSAFGTMDDWETLLAELHDRDMRLIMDLVVNHTSDEHEWFERSRREEAGFEDYYHWREGEPDEPPNNWESFFGGSAWSYDDEREAWYLCIFDEKQPDLNWRNPDVRDAVADVVEFWLEKGIDGFRLDAINHLAKVEGYPAGDPEEPTTGSEHFTHGPGLQGYLRELCNETIANYDVVTVAEMTGTPTEKALEYVGEDGVGIDMVHQFDHLGVDHVEGGWTGEGWGEWDLVELKSILADRVEGLGDRGWDPLFLGNHDQPRALTRFGHEGEYREPSAKLLGTLLLTARGSPFLYQGEEIGTTNAEFERLDEIDDPLTIGTVEDLQEAGEVDGFEDVRDAVNHFSRDHPRTPMQWSDEPNAGFTDGEPWLKVVENYPEVNVATARADDESVWHHYRRLIELRNDEDVLVYGDYELLAPEDEQVFAYVRTLDDETALVVLNWSEEHTTVALPELDANDSEVLIANYPEPPTEPHDAEFRPYEAVVYRR